MLLQVLPDEKRRGCLAELNAMPDISFEREMNMAYAHSRLIDLLPGSPLNSLSMLHRYMPKGPRAKIAWQEVLFASGESDGPAKVGEEGAGPESDSQFSAGNINTNDADFDTGNINTVSNPVASLTGAASADPTTTTAGSASLPPVIAAPAAVASPSITDPPRTPSDVSSAPDPASSAHVGVENIVAPLTAMHVDDDLQNDVGALSWEQMDESDFWPELKQAVKAFRRGSAWGSVWISLIDSFLVFEEMAGYVDNGKIKLGTDYRPSVIADFMRQRRNWSKKWDIGDLEVFGQSFWKWWRSLQPSSRIHEDRLIKLDIVDWDGLQDKSGRNGITLVIGVLLWWGEAVSDLTDAAGPGRREDWVLAVTDVTWALDNMIRHATFRKVSKASLNSSSPKRTAAEADIEKENTPLAKASNFSSTTFMELIFVCTVAIEEEVIYVQVSASSACIQRTFYTLDFRYT